MGAYLSDPITEKISSDEDGDRVACGASSMQGWRVSQEDAHNCIIDFDANTSLFAVYDGHGGQEVALYCSQKLPDFIKSTDGYQKGDMHAALIEAFLGFDATIATPEVIAILKGMVTGKDAEEAARESSEGETEDVNNLYEEASMPLEKVMEKYKNPLLHKLQASEAGKFPISPFLRGKRRGGGDEAGSSGASCSKTDDVHTKETTGSDGSEVGNNSEHPNDNKTEVVVNCEAGGSGDASISANEDTSKNNGETLCAQSLHNGAVIKVKPTVVATAFENGDGDDIDLAPRVLGSGKALDKSSGAERDLKDKILEEVPRAIAKLRKHAIRHLYDSLLAAGSDSDDSDDDQDDTFEGTEEDSDDDEEGASDADEESSDPDDDDEDEEEGDSIEGEDDPDMKMTEEPGSDSGCTAVVALMRGNELFVANAGDSRCVVCRKGKVIEMSFDHKPENEEENTRIEMAGGEVTADGRVNGGLNLSRAIGDHAYKQNKELTDKEQMITAMPDIIKVTINPEEDEFMVLACDGIWNFMSNEEVVDFVGTRLKEGRQKISQICEEMFDHCLAPNTIGDGTGCDNMTAIIVQFKTGLLGAAKRPASPILEESSKRAKLEEPTAVPTSDQA